MSKPVFKYAIQITQVTKYDWSALVADTMGDKPNATSILAKSLPELMAKCLVAVVLHDKNAGIPESAETAPSTNGDAPIILTPSRKIVTPPEIGN